MSRRLVIGDIHGGLKPLKEILINAEVTPEDQIIFLGDYVDGWADCFELIDYLIELNTMFNCVFLRGNHDKWLEDALTTGVPDRGWLQNGGKRTWALYSHQKIEDVQHHLDFLRGLHNYYISDDNIAFVHGGYAGVGGLKDPINSPDDYYWDRSLIQKAIGHHQKFNKGTDDNYEKYFPKALRAHKEIYIGHTNTLFWNTTKPILVCNLINMDTGCGYKGGYLSMIDVDTKAYWQSTILGELYPDDPHTLYGRQ